MYYGILWPIACKSLIECSLAVLPDANLMTFTLLQVNFPDY